MTTPDRGVTETLAALATALLAVVLGAGSVAAQTPATDSSGTNAIAGYGDVSWGADSAAVVTAEGPPHTVREIDALGARALVYAERTLGRTRGSLGYLVHRSDGLLRVMYLTDYGSGEVCLDMYQNLRDTVRGMYPDIARRERMYNESEDLAFCTAFQLGQAGARTIWRDARSGARAWVALDLDAGVVRVSFESPRYEPRTSSDAAAGEGDRRGPVASHRFRM